MKGLLVFISAIRNCGSKEAETKQINKELANIRFKFKGDKTLSGYQKKKYVCKLLFIFLLGHDIDFGRNEAVNLLICNRYTEKQIGYLYISVLSFENHPLMNLIISRMKEDLRSPNPHFVNLALQCMSHIATAEMAESLASDVMEMLVSSDTTPYIKQSAALCLVAFFRLVPNIPIPSDWKTRLVQLILDHNMGLSIATVSLIDVLAKIDPNGFKAAYSPCVSRLDSLHSSKYTDLQDYTYYFVPCPWFSVKLLRFLQNYPAPLDAIDRNRLFTILDTILATAQEPPKSKKVQHSNAKFAVMFEAIYLIISLDCSPKQVAQACTHLGQFLQHKETNHHYLALESLWQVATSEHGHEAVKQHKDTVISELRSEQDISVRQRAVDLLYAMCDRTNAESIVAEMLAYLEIAEHALREELVLKVAILSEKYATDYQWYVDVMLNLIRIAGDFVSQEVWHRVIQIVVNQESVQGYAAKMVFEAVRAPACHENMIKVGAFILGEFGNLIAGDPASSPEQQFHALHNKFGLCSSPTRQMLLSAYVKFVNLFPELKAPIGAFLQSDTVSRSPDIEVQQRAIEYASLCRNAPNDFLATVLEEMPPFPDRESNILAKLKSKSVKSDLNHAERSANDTPTMNAGTINAMRNGTSPADALGSNVPASAANNAGQNVLVDLLGDEQSSDLFFASPQSSAEVVTRKEIYHLLCKPGAALLDNNVIQIGYHLQKNQSMARMTLFYGNKSTQPLINFSTHVEWDGTSSPDQMSSYVQNELQPCDSSIECGIQIQQVLNVVAYEPFTQTMDLMVSFYTNGKQHRYTLTLPITLSLFLQPNQMSQDQYLDRWQRLTQPEQECAEEFRSVHPFDVTTVRSKLLASGLSVLDGIDRNVHNFVGAAVFPGRARQYGILYRLEPYPSSKTYRLTVRGTHPVLAKRLNHILRMQL